MGAQQHPGTLFFTFFLLTVLLSCGSHATLWRGEFGRTHRVMQPSAQEKPGAASLTLHPLPPCTTTSLLSVSGSAPSGRCTQTKSCLASVTEQDIHKVPVLAAVRASCLFLVHGMGALHGDDPLSAEDTWTVSAFCLMNDALRTCV